MLLPLDPVRIELHERQAEVFRSAARFRVLVAGRRFGKTHLALVEMVKAAQVPGAVVWYVGPSDGQSKRIAWERLKKLTRTHWVKKPNETELRIELKQGSTIRVSGAFRPDSLRGEGVDFLVLDEYASMKAEAWREVFRPALADRKGRALFIGTPQGRNHFYDQFVLAQTEPGWAAFQFTTLQGGLVEKSELESAGRELDDESYRQEFEAAFTNIGKNRAYHAFTQEGNVQRGVSFDGTRALVWSIDFNVNPMCMLLMQKVEEEVHVLEEIVIKPEAHTEAACAAFLQRAEIYLKQAPAYQRPLVVKIYGDASGNQKRTAGARTDWQIIKDFFGMWRGTFVPEYYVAAANPAVRDRVNCVNSRLRNHAGETRILIDATCKELIRDLEEVAWEVDATGAATSELNKRDRMRTHASDALGYFVAQVFGMKGTVGERGDGRVV